jgi:hypothetical protein
MDLLPSRIRGYCALSGATIRRDELIYRPRARRTTAIKWRRDGFGIRNQTYASYCPDRRRGLADLISRTCNRCQTAVLASDAAKFKLSLAISISG